MTFIKHFADALRRPLQRTVCALPGSVFLLSMMLTGCSSMAHQELPEPSYRLQGEDTTLGRAYRHQRQQQPDSSGFQLLVSGLDAFVARAALARAAEVSLDAQYYLLHDDLTGNLFLQELVDAARRGVRVRLLVDDMDLQGREEEIAALSAVPGIDVRIFNPFGRHTSRWPQFITRFGKVTRRMHNKAFIADGQAVILGGRNIGDEYFEANPALNFGDLDVLALGPVAGHTAQAFDAYWNHQLARPAETLTDAVKPEQPYALFQQQLSGKVDRTSADYQAYFNALASSRLARQLVDGELSLTWGKAMLLADDPDKLISDRRHTQLHLSQELEPYFLGLKKRLIIFSPYFVPGEEGTEMLSQLVARGVRVQVLTNSLAATDVPLVHVGYARYRKALLQAGVELYEMNRKKPISSHKSLFTGSSKASLHAKSFVLDDRQVFIGSLNLDPRSLVENSEIGVVLEAPDIALNMAEWFDRDATAIAFKVTLDADGDLKWQGTEKGQPVVYDTDPYSSFWQRMSLKVMGLLPIESQL